MAALTTDEQAELDSLNEAAAPTPTPIPPSAASPVTIASGLTPAEQAELDSLNAAAPTAVTGGLTPQEKAELDSLDAVSDVITPDTNPWLNKVVPDAKIKQ